MMLFARNLCLCQHHDPLEQRSRSPGSAASKVPASTTGREVNNGHGHADLTVPLVPLYLQLDGAGQLPLLCAEVLIGKL